MKYLVQDGEKIKKATMNGLEAIKEGLPDVNDFREHGADDLADIIGYFNKEVPMGYYETLSEKQLYSYPIVGFKDIEALAIKYSEGDGNNE